MVFGLCIVQRAKKFVSDSPGLVDFAVGLVDFILHLRRRASESFRGKFLRKLNYRSTVKHRFFLLPSYKFVWNESRFSNRSAAKKSAYYKRHRYRITFHVCLFLKSKFLLFKKYFKERVFVRALTCAYLTARLILSVPKPNIDTFGVSWLKFINAVLLFSSNFTKWNVTRNETNIFVFLKPLSS